MPDGEERDDGGDREEILLKNLITSTCNAICEVLQKLGLLRWKVALLLFTDDRQKGVDELHLTGNGAALSTAVAFEAVAISLRQVDAERKAALEQKELGRRDPPPGWKLVEHVSGICWCRHIQSGRTTSSCYKSPERAIALCWQELEDEERLGSHHGHPRS